MGVWIETSLRKGIGAFRHVTPCMGVWIETGYSNGVYGDE